MSDENKDQIEGATGRADNVKGSKDDSPDIDRHDMGWGENTQVAMRGLDINKQMYQRDQGVDERYLIMPDPDRREGGGTTPKLPKDQSITA